MQNRTRQGWQAYQKPKERARARSAAITLAGQDIAPLPKVADSARRAHAERDFKFFCETCFSHLFTLAWSQDHLRVIAKIERVVRYRETLAVAMPRGTGKSSMCLVAVLWAVLSGRRGFGFVIPPKTRPAWAPERPHVSRGRPSRDRVRGPPQDKVLLPSAGGVSQGLSARTRLWCRGASAEACATASLKRRGATQSRIRLTGWVCRRGSPRLFVDRRPWL